MGCRCRSGPPCRRPGWRRRCRSRSSCWWSRCRCRLPPTSGAPVLEADVEVDRRHFTVRASLHVADGERLALFGPSGAGKSTLLEAIAGLVPVRSGRVALGGRVLTSTAPPRVRVPVWQRGVGLLRQQPSLFPHLTVAGNLRYGLGPGQAGDQSVDSLARALGIAGLLHAMPARLSGGQAHRVALGRLLLAGCDALLLDEPYAGLDHALRRSLTGLVVSFAADRQLPAVLVAHELAEAQAFADGCSRPARPTRSCCGPPAAGSPSLSATSASCPPARGSMARSPGSIRSGSCRGRGRRRGWCWPDGRRRGGRPARAGRRTCAPAGSSSPAAWPPAPATRAATWR